MSENMTQAEARKIDAEIASLMAMTAKLNVETQKLAAEGNQLKMSTFLAPFLAAAGLMGATAAIVKLFF